MHPARKDPTEVFLRAKKEFGITDDFREAGFILPSGEMLDFSNRQREERSFPGKVERGWRTIEHDRIYTILPGVSGPIQTRERSDSLQFFQELGAIRFSALLNTPDPAINIELNTLQTPTKAQIIRLRQAIALCRSRPCDLFYDIFFEDGESCSRTKPGPSGGLAMSHERQIQSVQIYHVDEILKELEDCKKQQEVLTREEKEYRRVR